MRQARARVPCTTRPRAPRVDRFPYNADPPIALRDLHEIAQKERIVVRRLRWISCRRQRLLDVEARSFPSQRGEAADNGADSTMPTFGTEIERPSDVALKVEIARDRLQFLHKTSLADARLPAHDDDRPRGPLSDRRSAAGDIARARARVATDDRQAAGGGLPQPLEAKDRDGALEALQIVSAEGFVVREPGGHPPDFLRHERLVGSRLTEQPGGEIGRLAHDGIFAPPLAADPARHDLTHGEPDMDGERARGRSELRGDSGRLDLERRAHGAQAIVAVRARAAPNSAIAASPICLSIVPP